MTIRRVTFFKIADDKDIEEAIKAYEKLEQDQKKDGKPYILSCKAAKLYNDPRSQGYTLAATTMYSSLDDMKYYDDQCDAHAALKATIKPKVGGPPMVVYMDA